MRRSKFHAQRGRVLLWVLGAIWFGAVGFFAWQFGPTLWYRYVSRPQRKPPKLELGPSQRDPAQKRPFPASTPLSLVQLEADQLAWGRRKMLEAYLAGGRRDARWDRLAESFLKDILPWAMLDRTAPARPSEKLLPAADALLSTGCDDPVVLGLIGTLKHALTPDLAEGYNLLKRAVASFPKARYQAAVGRWFAGELERSGRSQPAAGKITAEVDKLALVWMASSMTDGSYDDAAPGLVLQHYLRGTGEEFYRRQEERCAQIFQAPQLPLWVRAFATGRRLYEKGWEARRKGDWTTYRSLLGQSRAAFEASAKADPTRPEPANQMIRVSGSIGPMAEPRQWFERAVGLQMDYPACFSTLAWYYLPRWGGSHRLILELGEEYAATGRYDTLMPLSLVQACDLVDDDMDDSGQIYRHPHWSKRLQEVFQKYESEPAQESRRAYFRSVQCIVAWKSGDMAEAYRLLRALDFQLERGAVLFFREDLDWITSVIIQSAHPQQPSLEEIDLVRKRGDRIAARSMLRELLALEAFKGFGAPRRGTMNVTIITNDEVREYLGPDGKLTLAVGSRAREIRSRLAALDLSERLEGPGWNRFLPSALQQDQALVGWTRRTGEWQMREDGALEGQAPANALLLVSDTAIGPDFDVRGEFELEAGATEATISLGGPDFSPETWVHVRLQRDGAAGRVVVGTQFTQGSPVSAVVREKNAFLVRCWQGRLTVNLNGATVLTDAAPPVAVPRDPEWRVGVGSFVASGPAGGKVRFRNLEVQRLRAR